MLLFLISRVEREDVPRIEYLYRRYHGEMVRLVKARLKRVGIKSYETDAENVVQNAFLKMCKYIKKIDLSVAERELKAYVMSIVINESNSFISDYKFVDPLGDEFGDVSDKDFFDLLSIKENYNYVVKAIENMDEKYSITLLYRYHKGMTVKQIAELMGIPEKTVYTRLMRGKQLLLELLKEAENV